MKPPGIILAGGLATRMGGGDKCLVRLGDKRLIDHLIARLRPQCGAIALNANGPASRFAEFGLPVLADSIEGHAGPLAGVLAGLDWAAGRDAEAIVTVAGDTPFFPSDLVERLMESAGPKGLAIAAAPDADGQLRRHPTFGLWPVALRHDLREALAGGLRKVGLWADRQGAAIARFGATPFDPFFNINTPEDVAAAERLLAAQGTP